MLKDPRLEATQEDLEAQHELMVRIRGKLAESVDAVKRLREVRRQVETWESWAQEQPAGARVSEVGQGIREQMDAVESVLTTEHLPNKVNMPPARLDAKLAGVSFVVATADGRPTKQSYDVYEDVAGRVDVQVGKLDRVIAEELPAFVAVVREVGVALVSAERGA